MGGMLSTLSSVVHWHCVVHWCHVIHRHCQWLPPSTLQANTCSGGSSGGACCCHHCTIHCPLELCHPPYCEQMLAVAVVVLIAIVVTQCWYSTHSPPHEQLLKGLDAGGVLSAVLPGDSIVSNGALDEALKSVYLVGIPLYGSPGTPLPPVA
jgi:hypothetical protein